MKEIGGYFQLEEMPGEEYYPDLYRVNLGRTALLWLLKSRRCRKILLPYFLCESVVHTCQENQIETEFYHLNEKLEVLYPKEQLPEGEYLYLVNYYGQLSDPRISEYKKIYGNIIVDHTHAFFQKPLKGIDTLYSCRKFWGVSDEHIFPQMQCFRWISQWIIPIKEWDISLGGTKKMQASTIRRCFRMQLGMKAWRFDVCPG